MQDFQSRIEEFIERHGLSPTTFGLWAMNDSRFVFDLRDGRLCLWPTVQKVLRFMEEYEAKQAAKRSRELVEQE